MISRVKRFFKRLFKKNKYRSVHISPEDITEKTYKGYLGGGKKYWDSRGEFQLIFLTAMGLKPFHKMLDVGCGPVRGGEFFIEYLDQNKYWGMDFNQDFITASKEIIAGNPKLSSKVPVVLCVDQFAFAEINTHFDYVLVFSVLNHCTEKEKHLFFNRLDAILTPETRVFITHAYWFHEKYMTKSRLVLKKKLDRPSDISPTLDLENWGWQNNNVFPILELTL